MMYMGAEGYRQCAIKIKEGAKMIERCVREELDEELVMMGRVDTSVISFTTRRLNIFDIAEYMKTNTSRKWSLAVLQKPAGVHFAVTMANVDNCAEFTEDLRSAVQSEVDRVEAGGKIGISDSAAIYGSTASVPSILVNELIVDYLDACYELPKEEPEAL
jgi:sphinganine-1-phosphate aldolase